MAEIKLRVSMQDVVNEMAEEFIRNWLRDWLNPMLASIRRTHPVKRKRHGIARHVRQGRC